jgi:nicotinate-nucleotide adenylyltransferase
LILGADQASAFTRWRAWQDIVQIATILVAYRPDTISGNSRLSPISLLQQAACAVNASLQAVQSMSLTPMAVSATDIRQRVAQGLDIQHLVPESIAGYIAQHHLYQTD